MEMLTGVLGAFGLSASAGLNAYIPLLVISLTARFTDLIHLREPWDALTSWWIIGLLLVKTMRNIFTPSHFIIVLISFRDFDMKWILYEIFLTTEVFHF